MKLTFEGTNEEFNDFIARLVTDVEEIILDEDTDDSKSENDVKEIPSVKKSSIDIYPPQQKYFWVNICGEIVSIGGKGISIRPDGLPSVILLVSIEDYCLLRLMEKHCHCELKCRAALISNERDGTCRLEVWDVKENQIEFRKYE